MSEKGYEEAILEWRDGVVALLKKERDQAIARIDQLNKILAASMEVTQNLVDLHNAQGHSKLDLEDLDAIRVENLEMD